jgi:antitoxin VapB
MGLNIKNPAVEKLAAEVARMANETKTEAIRRALEERKARLRARGARATRGDRLREFLEQEVWPNIPRSQLGKTLTREEEDEILGYGRYGV